MRGIGRESGTRGFSIGRRCRRSTPTTGYSAPTGASTEPGALHPDHTATSTPAAGTYSDGGLGAVFRECGDNPGARCATARWRCSKRHGQREAAHSSVRLSPSWFVAGEGCAVSLSLAGDRRRICRNVDRQTPQTATATKLRLQRRFVDSTAKCCILLRLCRWFTSAVEGGTCP